MNNKELIRVPKFNIGEIVYCMHDNAICEVIVTGVSLANDDVCRNINDINQVLRNDTLYYKVHTTSNISGITMFMFETYLFSNIPELLDALHRKFEETTGEKQP